MSKKNIPENEQLVETAEMDPNTVYAKLIKEEDGYHIVDFDGTVGPVCKVNNDGKDGGGTDWIIFTPNTSNRKYMAKNKADKIFEEGAEFIPLYYKATKHLDGVSSRIPNEKLISYLPEAEQAEYRAIIARAMAARDADKKKPLTELEKAELKLEKAKAALAKLQAEAAGETTEA